MSETNALLRHFLAALAYRTQKALRDAPASFGSFRAGAGELAAHRERGDALVGIDPAQLLQGPFSDAMTHAGQLAMLRRLAGSPVPPEDFVAAEISAARLGPDQARPRSPDAVWPEAPPGWVAPGE